jgi:UDP-N-acetyl-D-galactosamine dehydrogenase
MDVIHELREFGVDVHVHDPGVDPHDALDQCDIRLCQWDDLPAADALILAVAHRHYVERPVAELRSKIVRCGCFVDIKSLFDPAVFLREGLHVWRL